MKQNKLFTTTNIIYCSIFTALITIGAFIQIPVPYMDYFTLQFFFVLLDWLVYQYLLLVEDWHMF